jgi:hypothetical protein
MHGCLVCRLQIVRRRVRKMGGGEAATTIPISLREYSPHADVAGDELVYDPHLATDLERPADGRVVSPFRAPQRRRERSFGQSLEIFPGYDTFSMHTVANPVSERP